MSVSTSAGHRATPICQHGTAWRLQQRYAAIQASRPRLDLLIFFARKLETSKILTSWGFSRFHVKEKKRKLLKPILKQFHSIALIYTYVGKLLINLLVN